MAGTRENQMQNWVYQWQMVNKTKCPESSRVSTFLEMIVSMTNPIFTDDNIVASIQKVEKH